MRHGTFLRYVHPRPSSMKHRAALGAVALACGARYAPPPPGNVTTRLHGYQETPQTINTAGSGEFKASNSRRWNGDRLRIDLPKSLVVAGPGAYSLRSTWALGRVVLFLCTNGTPPANVRRLQLALPPGDRQGDADRSRPYSQCGTRNRSRSGWLRRDTEGDRGPMRRMRTCITTLHPSGEIRGRLGHD